jgi:hypothetical protein
MPELEVAITKVDRGWSDDFGMEEWTVNFEFDLKGDHYIGESVYCAGNEFESTNHVSVTLDGVDQYPQRGHWNDGEWVPFADTYLARVIDEDIWTDEFIFGVLNPIQEAIERAIEATTKAIAGTTFTIETE